MDVWTEKSTSCQRRGTWGVEMTMEVILLPERPQSDWYLSGHHSYLGVWRMRLPPYRADPSSMHFDTLLLGCNSFL